MPTIRNLLRADRIWRLMAAGLSLEEAATMDDDSAILMLEAWDIAMGDDDCVLHVTIIGPEGE